MTLGYFVKHGLVFLLSYSVQELEIKTPYPRHCPDLHIFTMYAVKNILFQDYLHGDVDPVSLNEVKRVYLERIRPT